MRKRRLAIVNVNLEYEIPADYDGTDKEFLENVELPKEYVTGSFDLVKIVVEDENGNIVTEGEE